MCEMKEHYQMDLSSILYLNHKNLNVFSLGLRMQGPEHMTSYYDVLTYGAISSVFGYIKAVMQGLKRGWKAVSFSMFISVSTAIIAGYVGDALGFSQGFVFFLVSIVSLLSDNILRAIIKFGDTFEHDPLGTIKEIKDKL